MMDSEQLFVVVEVVAGFRRRNWVQREGIR